MDVDDDVNVIRYICRLFGGGRGVLHCMMHHIILRSMCRPAVGGVL